MDWARLLEILKDERTQVAGLNTLKLSLAVAGLSSFFAVPLAWLLTRTDLIGKNIFRSLFCLPYTIPAFIGAIGWIILANPMFWERHHQTTRGNDRHSRNHHTNGSN